MNRPVDEQRRPLVELLKGIFRLDQADLDFGCYRILHARAREVHRFLEEELPQSVGEDAAVYEHLHRFFERYRNGALRSRRAANPHSDDDVSFHWANKDQYYVKSDEHFSDFCFEPTRSVEAREVKSRGQLRVHFRVVPTTEPIPFKASAAPRRFFLLHAAAPIDLVDGALVVRFEHRPDPEKKGPERTWQRRRNDETVAAIVAALKRLPRAKDFLTVFQTPAPTPRRPQRILLERYLAQYTERDNRDYFLHNDLEGFLHRELDAYLRHEVLNLDDLDKHLTQRVRQNARKIIALLAPLEDFQKKLWLKKKFILDTGYLLTLDLVPSAFLAEIAANAVQRQEWVRLFAIDASAGYSEPLTVAFLEENRNLVLDTGLFSADFTARLLATIDDLDALCAGELVHAENFHALRLLHAKYRDRVDCVYIDPPYNTTDDTFLYKNCYKHSSWLSMVAAPARLAKELLAPSGVFLAAIDDAETHHLRLLLDEVFGLDNYLCTLAVEVNPAGQNIRPNVPARSHDYCHIYARQASRALLLPRRLTPTEAARFVERDEHGPFVWDNLRRRGGNSRPTDRPGQWFPLYAERQRGVVALEPFAGAEEIWPIDPRGEPRIWRVNPDGARRGIAAGEIAVIGKAGRTEIVKKSRLPAGKKPKTLWKEARHSATTHGTKLLGDMLEITSFTYPKSLYLVEDCLRYWCAEDSVVLDCFAGSGTTAQAVLALNRADGGRRSYVLVEMGAYFDTVLKPRVVKAVYSPIWSRRRPADHSHGVTHLCRYFRLESHADVLHNLERKEEPALPHALRYRLDVDAAPGQSALNVDDFLDPTVYTLEVEKPGSSVYESRTVDLLETFNYLLGLHVVRLDKPQAFAAEFRREVGGRLVVAGKMTPDSRGPWWFRRVEGWLAQPTGKHRVLIIWRKRTGDFDKDNAVLDAWFEASRESLAFDTIYVNGPSRLADVKRSGDPWQVRRIEDDFHRLMWDGVDGSAIR